jgi:hypothetical protein
MSPACVGSPRPRAREGPGLSARAATDGSARGECVGAAFHRGSLTGRHVKKNCRDRSGDAGRAPAEVGRAVTDAPAPRPSKSCHRPGFAANLAPRRWRSGARGGARRVVAGVARVWARGLLKFGGGFVSVAASD